MPGGASQFDQSHYQWRADDDAIGSETNLEAEDTSHDVAEDDDTPIRLHVQVADVLNGATGTSPQNKQLEVRHHDGVSWGPFADVTGASSFIRAVASAFFDDGDACSDDLTDSSSNLFFASLASDENDGITANVGYIGDRRHQGVWNLQPQSADLNAGDQLELRIEDGGADITQYDVTAHIDIVAGAAAGGPAGGAAEESRSTARQLGRPEKPEGDSPAEQSATLTPNPTPPQFRGPTIINPPVTIRGLGPGISESLEEDIENPTMPTPMPEPPLKFN